jgi:hypothetical protein
MVPAERTERLVEGAAKETVVPPLVSGSSYFLNSSSGQSKFYQCRRYLLTDTIAVLEKISATPAVSPRSAHVLQLPPPFLQMVFVEPRT